MAVRIRLKRLGRARRAFWRICATDKRAARDGRVIEELGHYDPLLRDEDKVKIHRERVVHWLQVGASPSKTVTELLAHLGLDAKGNEMPPRPWKKKKKGPPPKAAERVAAEKAKPKEKAPPEAEKPEAEQEPVPPAEEVAPPAEEAATVPDEAQPEAEAEAPPDEPAAEAQPDEQKPAEVAEGPSDQAESPEPDAASQAQQNEPSEEGAPE